MSRYEGTRFVHSVPTRGLQIQEEQAVNIHGAVLRFGHGLQPQCNQDCAIMIGKSKKLTKERNSKTYIAVKFLFIYTKYT